MALQLQMSLVNEVLALNQDLEENGCPYRSESEYEEDSWGDDDLDDALGDIGASGFAKSQRDQQPRYETVL